MARRKDPFGPIEPPWPPCGWPSDEAMELLHEAEASGDEETARIWRELNRGAGLAVRDTVALDEEPHDRADLR